MRTKHPKTEFLHQLAAETEHGLLFVAEKMAKNKDLDGLHAVLDAIVAHPQKLFQDNVLVNTVGRQPAGASYDDVFAEILKPAAGRRWSDEQRDFYERLLPLIESTGIVKSLSRQLMQTVDDLALVEGIGANRTVSLVDKLTESIEQGNVLVAAGLISQASKNDIEMSLRALDVSNDHLFMYSVNSSSSLHTPVTSLTFSHFASKIHENEETRRAALDVLDRIEAMTGPVIANNFRMRMVEAEINSAKYDQTPVDMQKILAVTGHVGNDIAGTVIEREFARVLTRKDFERVDGVDFMRMGRDPSVSVAKAALENHALPLIRAAWPIFANKSVDPMTIALKSSVFSDKLAFQETIEYLDQRAKEWKPPIVAKGFLQRMGELVTSKIPSPPKRITLDSAMHYLAENPEITHWNEKMAVLLKMGADPSTRNYAGYTPGQLIPDSAIEKREAWEKIERTHAARKMLHGLLKDPDISSSNDTGSVDPSALKKSGKGP